MSDRRLATKNYVAIIDIGSNAVRLVVYDGLNRAPVKIHSERIICNLGVDLSATGRLNPDSVKKALNSLRRFSGLLAAMKIRQVRAVATAALRDAKDGRDFIDKVQKEFGLKILIIDGDEEARLSALGVLANGLGGDGVIGDYGGGSLELIIVENRKVKQKISLPLGSHRLMAEAGRAARIKMIDAHLARADFLKNYIGRDFYAMGGAWRSLAKAHLHLSQHPIKMLDHYQIEGKKAAAFAGLISRQSMASLEKTTGLSKKRVKDMAVAALAMERLFETLRPHQLIFSGTGLREGLLFDQLKPSLQRQDALRASCTKIALTLSRFDDLKAFRVLLNWMKPLFAQQGAEFLRLLEASCLLSDTGWFEHEDYQAEHAFQRILVMPFYGIDHAGRAFLALSQYVRYRGSGDVSGIANVTRVLLDNKMADLAIIAGLAQHLGYLLTGGALGLLKGTELKVTPKQLILKMNDKAAALNADVISDALDGLAAMLKREPVFKH